MSRLDMRLATAIAGAALAAGCTLPMDRLEQPARWLDTGTPHATVAMERATRLAPTAYKEHRA